jgi:hypothetical protein
MNAHDQHETIRLTGQRRSGAMLGWLDCLDCRVVVRELVVCGARTKSGQPCRAIVRDDLGHTRCYSHSGQRPVSRRRRRPAA